jgi:hypothetical protein
MYAHTRGDIDMQIVELLLSKAQTLKVGEVSLIDGKKSMCINVDGYFGGGQGPVWATEGTKIVFTTRNHCSLMEGICTTVYPDCLNVTIELTKANTWGKFLTGTSVRLHSSSIHRYHLATSDTEILMESSRRHAAEVFNKKAFQNISLKEIHEAIESEHHLKVKDRIGKVNYQYLQDVIGLYLRISKKVGAKDVGGNRSQIDQLINRLHDRINEFKAD